MAGASTGKHENLETRISTHNRNHDGDATIQFELRNTLPVTVPPNVGVEVRVTLWTVL